MPNLIEIQDSIYQEELREGDRKRDVAIWDCGSPLYDSFELASLSHMLERHLMALPFTKDPLENFQGADGHSERMKVQIAKVERKRDKLRLLRAVFNALAFWRRIFKVGAL